MNGAGKKCWGWYKAGDVWLPIQVNVDGKIIVIETVGNLGDIDDVDLTGIADGDILYWDDATSTWKVTTYPPSKIVDADGDTYVWVEKTPDEDAIHGVVKGVEVFVVHDDGIINLPKQSTIRVHSSTEQLISDDTNTKVRFDVEDYDIQGEYDNVTNYRFTAKRAGIYVISAAVEFRNVTIGDFCVMYVYKNGALLVAIAYDAAVTAYHQTSGAATDKAVADDYYEIWVRHKHGYAVTIGTNIACSCSITKIA